MTEDLRPPHQIREHYEVEKTLAARLRNSTREERRQLYRSVYDDLFQQLPHHPQLAAKAAAESAAIRAAKVAYELNSLMPFLRGDMTFMEIGPGDCALSLAVAKRVQHVYAVDVSTEVTSSLNAPPNFTLLLSDGCSVPAEPNSVNLVYSNQLMEHLHPDDAEEQLADIYRVLTPGGIYFCITPNRLNGPHDVSRGFDEVATGLHLKEYTTRELSKLFDEAGFSSIKIHMRVRRVQCLAPVFVGLVLESLFELLPARARKRIGSAPWTWHLLGIKMVATK